ncbi:MAG TPA: hypothetical protein VFD84_17810 [Candidatus Binatia bacterium]|nr:hypothetical protein [Candidatus Binatia bacterium]
MARTTARQRGRKAAAKGAGRNAAAKRIAALEAENRRLREEIAALQARREEAPVPAFNLTADETETGAEEAPTEPR